MIDDARIEAIFAEMDRYVLELANDPASFGPRYFQDIIATCRNYLNNVSLVVSELTRAKLFVSSELRKLEAVFELEFDQRLSSDPHVQRLANIKDRESMVRSILREQSKEIEILRDKLKAIEAVAKVVSHRSRELHATMNAIKDQRRLMQTEIDTGSFYGDERTHRAPSEVGLGPLGGVPFDEEEISAMLEDAADPSAPVAQAAPPPPPPKSQTTVVSTPENKVDTDEEAIRKFLGDATTVEPSKSVSQTEDEDISSLLDGI